MIRVVAITLLTLVVLTSVASAQSAVKGKEVYAAQKCSICHSIADVGNKKGSLDKIGSTLSVAEMHTWVTNAPEMAVKAKSQRKPAMKAYTTLTKDDVDSLVAYLQTLK